MHRLFHTDIPDRKTALTSNVSLDILNSLQASLQVVRQTRSLYVSNWGFKKIRPRGMFGKESCFSMSFNVSLTFGGVLRVRDRLGATLDGSKAWSKEMVGFQGEIWNQDVCEFHIKGRQQANMELARCTPRAQL